MDRARFERLQDLFERLRSLPAAAQAEQVAAECGEDHALRAELVTLLGTARDLEVRLPEDRELVAPHSTAPRRLFAEFGEMDTGHVQEDFGRYRTVALLGQGGMGTVHLAIDTQLEREVALKRIRPERLLSPAMRRRFVNETKAVSRLDHPNICRVFDAGEHEGQPFLIMQHIRGESLAAKIAAAAPVEAPQSLLWIQKLAQALHHAHERGLVHRDVKPSNILVDANGEPFLLDFGLARIQGASEALTATGEAPGTYRYMSPEQLRGVAELDARTDVFSLALVLGELLLQRHPFAVDSDTDLEVVHGIQHAEPVLSGRRQRRLGADLTAVLRKALAKNPEQRYGTALQFAEDLERVRGHEPVAAAELGRVHSVRRWLRRHPTATLAGALLAVSLVVVALFAQAVRARSRLDRDSAQQSQLVAAMRGAIELPRDPVAALTNAVAAAEAWPAPATDSVLWRSLAAVGLAQTLSLTVPPGTRFGEREMYPIERWTRMACSPNNELVARITEKGGLHVTDLRTGKLVASQDLYAITMQQGVGSIVTFDRSGGRLIIGCLDGIRILGVRDWKLIALVPLHEDQRIEMVTCVCLSADDRWLAAGGARGTVLVYDMTSRNRYSACLDPGLANSRLELSPAGDRLLVAQIHEGLPASQFESLSIVERGDDGKLSYRQLRSFADGAMICFCWHPSLHWVVVGTTSGTLLSLDTRSGHTELLADVGNHMVPYVRCCSFDQSGEHLLAGISPGLLVFDWDRGRAVNRRSVEHPHGRPASAVDFRSDGRLLAALFGDGSIGIVSTSDWQLKHWSACDRTATLLPAIGWAGIDHLLTQTNATFDIWQAPPGNHLSTLCAPAGTVRSIDPHPTRAVVALACEKEGVYLHDFESGAHRLLPCGGEPQRHVRFSADGSCCLTLGAESVRVFDTDGESATPLFERRGSLAMFLGDREMLLAEGGKATLVDLERSAVRGGPIAEFGGRILAAAYDEGTRTVYLGGSDRFVHRVSLDAAIPSSKPILLNSGNSLGAGSMFGNVMALATVSGGRKTLVSRINNYFTILDNADTEPQRHSPNDRFGGLLAIDPRGRCAAIADFSFGRLSWLDLRTFDLDALVRTDVHTQRITALRFSKSGRLCLSASLDGTVCLWETETRTLHRTMRLEATTIEDACFTADEQWFVTADGRGRVQRWPVEPLPAAKRYLEELAARSR